MKDINKLKIVIRSIISEQGRLSRLKTSGMGTNHPFTVKSQKVSLGTPGKYNPEEKENSGEKLKVQVSKAFLKKPN